MRTLLRHRLSGLVLTLTLTLASLAMGFAHRAPLTPSDVERIAHAVFWGEAVPDICGPVDENGEAVDTGECRACQLVGSALLPDPVRTLTALDRQVCATVQTVAILRLDGTTRSHDASPRAPPLA